MTSTLAAQFACAAYSRSSFFRAQSLVGSKIVLVAAPGNRIAYGQNAEYISGFGHRDTRPLKAELVDLKQHSIVSKPLILHISFKILEADGLVVLSKKRAVARLR